MIEALKKFFITAFEPKKITLPLWFSFTKGVPANSTATKRIAKALSEGKEVVCRHNGKIIRINLDLTIEEFEHDDVNWEWVQ